MLYPKGDEHWVFIGRTDVEAETPILWPPDVKSWLIGKDPDAGKDWGQAEEGTTEDEMVGWHHRLNGHEVGWTPGVGDRQGGLVCCGSWGHKELDTTERLNWTELILYPNAKKPCFLSEFSLFLSLYFIFLPQSLWDLVSQPEIEPGPLIVKAQSSNHWTTKDVPRVLFLKLAWGIVIGPWLGQHPYIFS